MSSSPEQPQPPASSPQERDLTEAARQIGALSASGAPLAPSLHALASEAPSAGLRDLFEQLASQIEKGSSLATALATLPNLPPGLANLIQLGEQSGRRDLFIPEYVEHREATRRLHLRILLMILYPSVLLLLSLSVFTFLVADIIVNTFLRTLKLMRTQLPAGTQVVYDVSEWALRNQTAIGIVASLSAIALIVSWLPAFRERAVRGLEFVIPYLGQSLVHRGNAGFCRLLASLLESRIPLPVALRAAGEASGYVPLRESSRYLAIVAERGQDLHPAALREDAISPDLAHALRWSSDGVQFVHTLRNCAELHGDRASEGKTVSLLFIENLGISLVPVAIGIIVLFLYLGFFYPAFTLLNSLA